MSYILWMFVIVCVQSVISDEEDFNTVNTDGSFSFGLSNNDVGSHTHSATGTANNVVRGRYASRNPTSGRIDETVYTAGPRGFRARGPNIHRKMDLSQIPRGPIGTPDDPQADPYEDPSYAFEFRSADHTRQENADSTGRVKGLYSYVDDVGERHMVRYAAGAGTGYEVTNAVPDTAAIVRYNAALYKASKKTRGRMAVERGPAGQYKFISSGPDQRRSESSGPDGIVRGSYSFLDDKGVQRTVEYIAGAGIGYRVVKSTIGPGTHILSSPSVPNFGITPRDSNDLEADSQSDKSYGIYKPSGAGPRLFPNRKPVYTNRNDGNTRSGSDNDGNNRNDEDENDSNSDFGARRPAIRNRPRTRINNNNISRTRYDNNNPSNEGKPSFTNEDTRANDFFPGAPSARFPPKQPSFSESDSNEFVGEDDSSKKTTSKKIARDSGENYGRYPSDDATLIKNVGDWYVGLEPGAIVRAHVQSIDLLPLGNRPASPSEALDKDFEGKL